MAAEIGVLAYDDRIKAGNWQRKAATHCLHNALLQLLVCDSFAGRPDEPWIDRIVIHLKERTVTQEHQVSTRRLRIILTLNWFIIVNYEFRI